MNIRMLFSSLLSIYLLIGCSAVVDEDFVPADQSFQAEALEAVNDWRRSGCNCGGVFQKAVPDVNWNSLLEQAAARHANDMSQNDFFSHTGSDGSTVGRRTQEIGYQWTSIGENIALGYSSIEEVIQGWIDSPGHCELMMSADYSEIGLTRSGTYWVMTLGKR
jgi:uncharacterized protein YkwD